MERLLQYSWPGKIKKKKKKEEAFFRGNQTWITFIKSASSTFKWHLSFWQNYIKSSENAEERQDFNPSQAL